jgi:thiol:disulfide interchange protein DsbD
VEVVSSLRWPEEAVPIADSGPQGDPVLLRGTGFLSSTGWLSWLLVLTTALVGGMLLNLMPCVFPVLSIKLLSLSQTSSSASPLLRRQHALAYALGVVLTFVGLAAVMLALREAGQAIGWGFQLQEPWVVLGLAMLFFALGLNLLGVFEWAFWFPSALADWRAERPSLDAFASGVLMVIAASPCTAPFMGAALGFAITQSAAVAVLVFAALGLGMALPYAVLVLLPGWRARLPRPGAWMLHLKQLLAFPMFLAMLWMLWVLGQQVGLEGLVAAAMCLLVLSFVLWMLGVWKSHPGWARGSALTLVVLSLWMASPLERSQPSASRADGYGAEVQGETAAGGATNAGWAPFDEDQLQLSLVNNQPVFVDFTAAWCITCQVNKKLVLDTAEVQQAFSEAGVLRMRADWTNRDAKITEALTQLGRTGVPVYVLHRPGKPPLLLPEVLTADVVREALRTL